MEDDSLITGFSSAKFSKCKQHRFVLWRGWDMTKPFILFIGLNPSRGNDFYNDPTITRCINFSKSWGFGGMLFGNLFSKISPKPDVIKNDLDTANHPKANEYLMRMISMADTVVFCWGSWKFIDNRKYFIHTLCDGKESVKCFSKNKDGNPKHPLYIKSSAQLINYRS